MAPLSAAGLRGWTPVRVWGEGSASTVEWAVIDGAFTEPFFEETLGSVMTEPFAAAFRRVTPIAALADPDVEAAAARPTGLIFHTSRCGSTLVAPALASLAGKLVLVRALKVGDIDA